MTDFALLPAVEIETGTPTNAAVIFLHGLGDDGHGWSDIVPALRLPTTLHIRFLFPHAPDMPVTINRGYEMPAWYDIDDADFRTRSDIATVRTSRVRIERLIARERHRGIASSRIVLGGFSQGGSLALYVGLRHTEHLAGLIALSAYVIDPDALEQEASPPNRHIPIFMAHGTDDDVVRFEWGDASRAALERSGWPVEWHAYPMGHSAALEEVEEIGRFISRVLG